MFYDEMAAIASNLLSEFGQLVTLTKYSEQYDINTGVNVVTPTDYKAWGAAFAYTGKEIDGERIVAGDMRVLLERSQAVPKVGDTVLLASGLWRVLSVELVSPSGIDVIYKLQVRQ